jgi:hypothetical protein
MSARLESHGHLRGLALAVALIGATACSRTATSFSDAESSSTTSGSTSTSDSSETSQTETTTETETETDTGETTMGHTFVPMTEFFGESCQCDTFQQDCPEGEKCVPYASTDSGRLDCVKCVTIVGDGQPGEACVYGGPQDATDDCGPTSYCFQVMEVDGQSIGVCTPFCQGIPDDPICPMGTDCLIANEGEITLCVAPCDPLLQDCGPGLGCFFQQQGFFCVVPAQEIPLGQPCEYYDDCAIGHMCVTQSVLPNCAAVACCASFCSLMQGAACPQMGTECVAFFEQGMVPAGYEDVGICVVPP